VVLQIIKSLIKLIGLIAVVYILLSNVNVASSRDLCDRCWPCVLSELRLLILYTNVHILCLAAAAAVVSGRFWSIQSVMIGK